MALAAVVGEAVGRALRVRLDDPVWSVEHVALCFGVRPSTAREYTRSAQFPAPRLLSAARRGGRHLWLRADVLAWFEQRTPLGNEDRDDDWPLGGCDGDGLGPDVADAGTEGAEQESSKPPAARRRTYKSRSAATLLDGQ